MVKSRTTQTINKLADGIPIVLTGEIKDELPVYAEVAVPHRPIIFSPNSGPQSLFLSSSEQEVLYGGAAGGGKTMGLIADALRDTSNGAFVGLVLRRTSDELREIISKTQDLYSQVYPTARWSEKKSEWSFPSGSRLWFTYLERDQDVHRYQGQAFSYVAFDELTQYATPYAWDYLRSRLRTTDKNLQLYQRATTNPGGVGMRWVKKMFIDPAPWGEAFWATDVETGKMLVWPKGSSREGQPLFKRRFIPAKLRDNPFLHEDGRYEAGLLSLPEHQRKQLLEGSWDVVEGAAFNEFNREVHVVKMDVIPTSWRRFRAADYGYNAPAGCLWFACAPDGQVIVYRELYATGMTADKFALKVLELEQQETITYGVLDSSVWHKRGDAGPPLAEQMTRVGCFWRPSDRSKGSRVAGKNEIHRRLQINPVSNKPGLVFRSNCVNMIAQFPLLQLDKNNPEDVDTKGEDHLYDALRYGLMSRPLPNIDDFVIMQKPITKVDFKPKDAVFGY